MLLVLAPQSTFICHLRGTNGFSFYEGLCCLEMCYINEGFSSIKIDAYLSFYLLHASMFILFQH